MLRVVRFALTVFLVISLGWSVWNAVQIAQSPTGEMLVDRSREQLTAAYERAVVQSATAEGIAARIDVLLSEVPRNWLVLDALRYLATERAIALSPDVLARFDLLRAADASMLNFAGQCATCAWDLRNCDLSGALICGVGINLTSIGDVVALSREGGNYLAGRPVDQFDVALSFVGLAAVGLVVFSGGSSLTVKAGAGLLKTAQRMGRISPDLLRLFTRSFREGLDWAHLPLARSVDDLAALARPVILRPAVRTLEHLGDVYSRLGMRPTLHLMRQVDTPLEAQRLARAAEVLGPRTVGVMEVLGKSRFMRAGLRWADEIWYGASGIAAAIASLAALFWSMLSSAGLRFVRRMVRR
jgi:hypothetical protein